MKCAARRRPEPVFRRAVVLVATVVVVAWGALGAAAAPVVAARDTNVTTGTHLVQRFFDLLKTGDTTGLETFLSPAFQLQGADGGFLTKEEFISNPSKVQSYQLSNVRVTRAGDVIVVRYDVAAVVTINGAQQSRAPAPRLSVFARAKKG